MIPITVITGFLGAGKTTLINKIIKENANIRFGLIINEFGEVGIDGQILDNPKEEIVEMSDGCLCCVVRSDLVEAIHKMTDTGKVDYIIVETSGLAEPAPILQTFMTMKADGIKMDCMMTIVDYNNLNKYSSEYKVVFEQIELADIIVVNKVDGVSTQDIDQLITKLKKMNEFGSIIINDKNTPSSLFIETNTWNVQSLSELQSHDDHNDKHIEHHHHNEEVCTNPEHNHSHNHSHNHHHEHNDVTEIVWKTFKSINPHKMDNWLQNELPAEVIRAKGILQIQTDTKSIKKFVFQMVGANKELIPLENYIPQEKIDTIISSSLVLIGKKLDKESILMGLDKVVD